MILPVQTQLWYFLSALLAGVVIGMLFDLYRVSLGYGASDKSRQIHPRGSGGSRILFFISDLLYWVLCAIVVFGLFLQTSNGSLGYYSFIGIALGLLLYFKLVSKRLIIGMRAFGCVVRTLFRITGMFIIWLVRCAAYVPRYLRMKLRVGDRKRTPKQRQRRWRRRRRQ